MAKTHSTKGQTTQWPKHKVQKDKQHNGQETKYKKTDNTMAKTQSTKGQTTQWPKHKVQKDKQYYSKATSIKQQILCVILLHILFYHKVIWLSITIQT